MPRSRNISLSEAQLSTFKLDAEQALYIRAVSATPNSIASWRDTIAGEVTSSAENSVHSRTSEASDAEQARALAFSYLDTVGDAAGHLALILAHALAFRHGLGDSDVRWVQEQANGFIREMSSTESVAEWFAVAAFGDSDAPRSPDFDKMVSRIVEKIGELPDIFPQTTANHKLMVALAILGRQRVKLSQMPSRPVLTLENLKGMESCSQLQAAQSNLSALRSGAIIPEKTYAEPQGPNSM